VLGEDRPLKVLLPLAQFTVGSVHDDDTELNVSLVSA